ncbi:MAG TPA: glycosyl hydrolase family 39 [Terriglobia bacterium]|nr:glycosyl hydrolase family 39 [Terriglobia bacterium]
MSRHSRAHALLRLIPFVLAAASCTREKKAEQAPPAQQVNASVNWDKVVAVSKTTPTLQVVVNPPLRRGSKIHDPVFKALHDLGADFVRYVPWLPYPRLGVAELEPPADGKTSWDFSVIDPMTEDFINATSGHSVVLNFSTIPQWMFKTEKPVPYPADPDEVTWDYEKGTDFRDPSLKELADYYARLVSWYTKGGFVDEYGQRHESGHHYKIDWWEVLNEVESEHQMTPQTYTRVYDAVVGAVRAVDPQIKFVGLALASEPPGYFEYFLNHKNHKPGIPIDMISYHFYAVPTPDQTQETMQYTYWDQADRFLAVVDYIQAIRARLSPETQTDTDELGSISADDLEQGKPGHVTKPIPNSYWTLCGALYAYLYAELAKRGVEVAGESQLVGYPTQYPTVSMVDWNTGQPNARYWVLKLLHDNFGPGDKLVETRLDTPYIYAQAFVTRQGQRKLLLVNKRDRDFEVAIPDSQGAEITYVNQSTNFQPPGSAHLSGSQLKLNGFEVAVVNLSR